MILGKSLNLSESQHLIWKVEEVIIPKKISLRDVLSVNEYTLLTLNSNQLKDMAATGIGLKRFLSPTSKTWHQELSIIILSRHLALR